MTEDAFKAELAASGFTEIETRTIDPRPANVAHGHDHDIRGLVLDGLFIVWCDGRPVSHQPGEMFSVAAGIAHAEEIGPAGARIVIGRRWAASVAT